LSELAAIVNQAKAASDDGLGDDEREMQVEKMVRLGDRSSHDYVGSWQLPFAVA
jgi:hypothetical protein